mmetsp:Transcript_70304/g.187262  ORF Transcript_70304/g.187262 Transcript_70304/m.187262 type:complete len:307 (-) Transcript_70304:130-1050(-)
MLSEPMASSATAASLSSSAPALSPDEQKIVDAMDPDCGSSDCGSSSSSGSEDGAEGQEKPRDGEQATSASDKPTGAQDEVDEWKPSVSNLQGLWIHSSGPRVRVTGNTVMIGSYPCKLVAQLSGGVVLVERSGMEWSVVPSRSNEMEVRWQCVDGRKCTWMFFDPKELEDVKVDETITTRLRRRKPIDPKRLAEVEAELDREAELQGVNSDDSDFQAPRRKKRRQTQPPLPALSTIDDVAAAKVRLEAGDRVAETLVQLDHFSMDLPILRATKIGVVVNGFCGNPEFGAVARKLVAKWREVFRTQR